MGHGCGWLRRLGGHPVKGGVVGLEGEGVYLSLLDDKEGS